METAAYSLTYTIAPAGWLVRPRLAMPRIGKRRMSRTSVAAGARRKRTQEDRAAATRQSLINATIALLQRHGYGGTTTERVAQEAGVSRGALQYHFPSRTELMADVMAVVHEREHATFQEILGKSGRGDRVDDWPDLLWEVLSRPESVAALEILQASRSDPELAARVRPIQARMDDVGLTTGRAHLGAADEDEMLAGIRFFTWAIRGLCVAQALVADPGEIARSVDFFRRLVEGAVSAGAILPGVVTEPDGGEAGCAD